MSEPQPVLEWKAEEGRNYVDILNTQTARIMGMQIEHLGSGLYIDRRTRKKYDYEEDTKGTRHYFEILA
jgi:nitrous oxidase accessory protein NosD